MNDEGWVKMPSSKVLKKEKKLKVKKKKDKKQRQRKGKKGGGWRERSKVKAAHNGL